MKPITKKFTHRSLGITLLYTAGFNTIIALTLSWPEFGAKFIPILIASQCIGLSIGGCCIFVIHTNKTKTWQRQLVRIAIGILAGSCIGVLITSYLHAGNAIFDQLPLKPFLSTLAIAVLFGVAVNYFFLSKYQISSTQNEIKQERIRRLSMEKEMAETQLRLLQAQIEPHFLFNTLSNVLSLIETDKALAAAMLTDLTRFLRSTLIRTRKQDATLGQELEIIRAYLNVIHIRMGKRLTYRIEVPEELLPVAFAPMLLQPLVENAIRHGLEPLIDGGQIQVGAQHKDRKLRVWVSDSGVGIQNRDISDKGFGLSNIKQRLKTLYGQDGLLVIKENAAAGLKAIIEVPIEQN